MPSELRLKRRVQFYETDAAGIVHFSWYFRYMEEAEHALWRASGMSISQPEAGIGWPRIAASCEFHRPLRFEDEFEIWIRVAAITEKTIRYECVMSKGDVKIATGSVTAVCVSKRQEPMKSTPIPPEIAARFQAPAGADAERK